jgi:hypothetical protein
VDGQFRSQLRIDGVPVPVAVTMSRSEIGKLAFPVVSVLLLAPALALGLARWPLPTSAAVAATVAVLLALLPARRSTTLVEWLLVFLLAGYAFLGRSFAYLGARPFFIGEIVLALVLIASLVNRTLFRPWKSKLVWALIPFACWGAVRTIPYLPMYSYDALRDAAIWGYSVFAIVVAGVLLSNRSLHHVVQCYRGLLPAYMVWIALAWVVNLVSPDLLPRLGPDGSALFQVKPGDASVHLAGIGAFMILGLHRVGSGGRRPFGLREWFLWTLWTANLLLFGSSNRGGLLSILIALSLVFVIRHRGRWIKVTVIALCSFSVLLFLDLQVDLGASRRVSPQQIAANLSSITGGGGLGFEGTRRWRLLWWQTILDYTIRGEYFWQGKGFGANLADEDGFQTDTAHSLRSPHNGHLTILARAGVPGFTMWVVLQGGMLLGLLRCHYRARRDGDDRRAALAVWILAYWVACIVDSAFDVYLEGPQGGIWFWTIFGMGITLLVAGAPGRRRRQADARARGLACPRAA